MSRARSGKYDMGNAISLEDALSIMIVTFVLFVLFLIPLVNIDRTKLEQAQQDAYWGKLTDWLKKQPSAPQDGRPYELAFNLEGCAVRVTQTGGIRYIEALSPKGEITVIRHEDEKYILFMVKEQSAVVTYRYGDIRWSASEQEWFTANNTIDYGEKEYTVAMQKEYRIWTKTTRGF